MFRMDEQKEADIKSYHYNSITYKYYINILLITGSAVRARPREPQYRYLSISYIGFSSG